MDNFRLILIMIWVFLGLLLYQAWEQDYGKKPTDVRNSQPVASSTSPATPPQEAVATPGTVTPESLEADASMPTIETPTAELPTAQVDRIIKTNSRVSVETDVFKVEIDTLGGDVRRIDLLNYPVEATTPDIPFRLMNDELPQFFIAQSGFLGTPLAPSHQVTYQAAHNSYQLSSDENTLEVKLVWENQGVRVNKIYTFERGSYIIGLKYVVENHTSEPWKARLYGQFQRTGVTTSKESRFIYTYTGGAISSPENRYEKIKFNDITDDFLKKEKRAGWKEGWVGMLQHYFVAAWIPDSQQVYDYYSKPLTEGRYMLGMYGPTQLVPPGTQQSFDLRLYVGPKLQDELADIAPGLDLTVDYGWLWFLAQPLFWVLKYVHGIVQNWGWSIIILTLLIKLAFFHLSATSYKSMANMRRLQPRLMALKDRYGTDKAKLQQAMMDLYRKEKINPLSGCLPILVQIPVFISLYWVLLESVELRQAPFILWLTDLSSPDPYFVLPLVMGVTMLLQHKLNPAPIDPVQQKVMMILPIVFTVFFAFFPAGLVLYWTVNNMLSITQQWVITKSIVKD